MYWVVSKEEAGLSLLLFLKSKLKETSNKRIKKAIDLHQCRINGKIEKYSSRIVIFQERIQFNPDHSSYFDQNRILYEDDYLLAYDKPPFLTSVSDSGQSLFLALKRDIPTLLPIHRLDRDTSGVLCFAKNPEAQKNLEIAFKQRLAKKTYFALVQGSPSRDYGCIEKPMAVIKKNPSSVMWGISEKNGLYAKTDWAIEKRGTKHALLRCMPFTGRTHQIRVHLQYLGCPIIGDLQYGVASEYANRTLLHAEQLEIPHPQSGKPLTLKADLPSDFVQAIDKLRLV